MILFLSARQKSQLLRLGERIGHARLTAIVISCALIISLSIALTESSLANLVHDDSFNMADLKLRWRKGDMIVLTRHVERCDHSTAPCLDSPDGITARAKGVALELGKQFKSMGLENTDIYSSPLTRAAQTSMFMFQQASAGQEWLFHCKGTMLRDVIQHKQKQRNLILVTHSECIDEFEKSLGLGKSKTLDYGASLFISAGDKNPTPHVLGYINSRDWELID